jgi:hypothetical protein
MPAPLRPKADPYRCDACRRKRDRCEQCRANRAAARRALRERKRADGLCLDCAAKAARGKARCRAHLRDVSERSGAAHRAAREGRD